MSEGTGGERTGRTGGERTGRTGGERTGRAALAMSVGTLLSRLTGFGRVVALAYALGLTHRLTDAYNLANTTPNIVFDFVLGGVLSATLIPVFVDRLATRSEAEAWRAISAVVSLVTVLLLLMTVAFEVASPELIRIYTFGTAHSGSEDHAATGLLRMFAPQLALYGWIVLCTALLNTRRRFAVPMFTPIANNLLVIFVLLVVRHIAHGMSVGDVSDHAGAYWLLGLGTTAGVAVQLIGQLPALKGIGIRLSWVWNPGHEVVRQMLRLSGWTFGFVATNQVALWVILLLANRRAGDVTIWVTAYTFFQLPYGIVAVSLMSAIQPALADSWARHRLVAFRRRMAGGLRAILSLVIPAAVGYLLLARPALEVVLRHGATTTTGTDRVAVATALLALGLPGFCVFQLLVRSYQAMKDARTPFFLYLLENTINVVGAVVLFPSLGVRGLALSVSIAYTVAALVALVSLRHRLGGIEGARLLSHLGRVGVPTLVMAVGVALVGAVITGQSTGALAGRVVLAVAVGGAAYLATAGVMTGVMARGRAA